MKNDSETWLPIAGFEGHYEASGDGRVRSLKRQVPYMLTPRQARNGYMNVMISMGGRYRPYGVHRLVLLAFAGVPPAGFHACHIDGDKLNNSLANLRWGSPAENAQDQLRHGTHRNQRKTHCHKGHEFTPENTYTQRGRGNRKCRACQAEDWRSRRKGGRPGARPKLNGQQAAEMRELRTAGWTYQALADRYGVSNACAYYTVRRRVVEAA